MTRHRQPRLVVPLLLGLLGAAAPGQEDPERLVAAAGERWLATDHSSRDEMSAAVRALLDHEQHGIAWLARQLPAAIASPAEPRSKGVSMLVTHLTLELLRRRRATGITFRGQYDALLPLQPMAGDLLFEWLLATPDWYPTTHRVHLVLPLRDLQPTVPPPDRLAGVVAIVEDVELESEPLRRGLTTLLWQWGTKRYAQAMITELTAATVEGQAGERARATLELADFYTRLGELAKAAAAHRAAQALAKSAGEPLKPVDWYAAACVHALLGEVDRGMAAIEACADLLASPYLDVSLRLPRRMFDSDPELAALRRDPRWAPAMVRAFSHPAADPPDRR